MMIITFPDKCSYVVPALTCPLEIGDVIVYHSAQGVCGYQRTGCNIAEIQPYAFNSVAECYRTCGNRFRG